MFGILILLFTVVPALEFYLLFKIGSSIGAVSTLFIIILTGIIGAALAKIQGLSILNKVSTELSQNKLPGKQILHGFIVFGGGLLLLTPGFITDILGFCMVIPGIRHLIVEFLKRYFEKGIKNGNIQFMNMSSGGSGFSFTQFTNEDEVEDSQSNNDPNVIEVDFKKKD
jgi:UPF0716 protein FxsA